jgi:hypothetical protein
MLRYRTEIQDAEMLIPVATDLFNAEVITSIVRCDDYILIFWNNRAASL